MTSTPNLNLSQFNGNDVPNWLTNYNGDMSKIDTAVGNVANDATSALGQATTAEQVATNASNTATTAGQNATSALATANSALQSASQTAVNLNAVATRVTTLETEMPDITAVETAVSDLQTAMTNVQGKTTWKALTPVAGVGVAIPLPSTYDELLVVGCLNDATNVSVLIPRISLTSNNQFFSCGYGESLADYMVKMNFQVNLTSLNLYNFFAPNSTPKTKVFYR